MRKRGIENRGEKPKKREKKIRKKVKEGEKKRKLRFSTSSNIGTACMTCH